MIETLFWISVAIGLVLAFLVGGGFIGLIAWPVGIFIGLASFATIPTLFLYGIVRIFSVTIDFGQLVVFTIFSAIFCVSVATYFGMKTAEPHKPEKARSGKLETAGYSSLFLSFVGLLLWLLLLISHYGFHAEFPAKYVAWLNAKEVVKVE